LHSDVLETSVLGLKVGNADVHGILPFVKLVFVVHDPHPDELWLLPFRRKVDSTGQVRPCPVLVAEGGEALA
jgi:hypothetical protein